MNMKTKVLICTAAMSLFILSCGGNKSEQAETKPESTATPAPAPAASDAIKEGEQLVAQNDCKTCHHSTNKIIGPAHTDVAKKYEFTAANVDLLADRIIKGSSGVWGEIPMNPHADLSVEDAKKMARYVLSLDGETEK
jgi:cytochrome c